MNRKFRLEQGQSFDIFISYRREDSQVTTGSISRDLARHFGKENVFIDTSANEPGTKYPNIIRERLNSCDVLIAVIGKHWRDPGGDGRRRFESSKDWVRQEVATALKRDILVIPVLVDGAEMPASRDLPKDMRGLAQRQYHEITPSRWEYDVGKLIKTIEPVIKRKAEGGAAQRVGSIYDLKRSLTVLALGAHADDIELGCGATLLYLKRFCDARIVYRVFSQYILVKGKRINREEEMKSAAKIFGAEFDCFNYQDRDFPNQWDKVQSDIASLREEYKPDLILVPSIQDTHQDHVVVARGALREFRHGQAVWHYEIKQYGQDRFDPNIFVNVSMPSRSRSQGYTRFLKKHQASDTLAHLKIQILQECMKKQAKRPEFNPELLLGIMRLRGIESSPYVQYAEAFEGRSLINGGAAK